MNWYGVWALKILGLAKQITAVEWPKLMREEIEAS